jgi:hypothetical protein
VLKSDFGEETRTSMQVLDSFFGKQNSDSIIQSLIGFGFHRRSKLTIRRKTCSGMEDFIPALQHNSTRSCISRYQVPSIAHPHALHTMFVVWMSFQIVSQTFNCSRGFWDREQNHTIIVGNTLFVPESQTWEI